MKAALTFINILIFQRFMLENNMILCLNEFRKNLAASLDRSPLIHSYGYASAGDRPILFAIFPLNFIPFMQYVS